MTVSISAIFEIARETNDYASESFMQWFVDEQVEEESTMDALLQVAERVREYPMMLEEFLARDGGELGSARRLRRPARRRVFVRAAQQRLVLVEAERDAAQVLRQLGLDRDAEGAQEVVVGDLAGRAVTAARGRAAALHRPGAR